MINRPNWSGSLRLKLVLTFAATLLLSIASNLTFDFVTREWRKEPFTGYQTSKQIVSDKLSLLEQELPQLQDPSKVNPLLTRESESGRLRIVLSDLQGNAVYRSDSVQNTRIDLYEIIYEQKDVVNNPAPGKEYTEMTPVLYRDQKLVLMVSGKLEAEQGYIYKNPPLYSVLIFFVFFLVVFYLLTYSKMREIQEMSKGVSLIAQGNLSIRLPVRSKDELGVLTSSINEMAGQLEEQMAKERLAEKTKSELITNISHDLRTPLTSIIGYLTVLMEHKEASGALKPYMQSALNKSNQLKKLIDDLFEYTRLASNQAAMEKQVIDLAGMLNQMIMEFIPLAERSDIVVQSTVPDHRVEASIDAGKIARAVDNLLTNALKFSVKPGIIDISLHADPEWATLSVANTGLDITKEQEEQLFDRFYKAEESRRDHTMPHGSGLGLSIARSIVQLHGGEIWLERNERHYEFRIRLPRKSEMP